MNSYMKKYITKYVAVWVVIIIILLIFGPFEREPRVDGDGQNALEFSNFDKITDYKGKGRIIAFLTGPIDPELIKEDKFVHFKSFYEGGHKNKRRILTVSPMLDIITEAAPDASIIPLEVNFRYRKEENNRIPEAIIYAADHGADVIVSRNIFSIDQSKELRDAIFYAEEKNTLFVTSAMETFGDGRQLPRRFKENTLENLIIHCHSLPDPNHAREPEIEYNFYTLQYELHPRKNGKTYASNLVSTALTGSLVALLKEKNPKLGNKEIRDVLNNSTYDYRGFAVLDAEKAISKLLD